MKYATRLYDAATRAYRRHTYQNFDAVVRIAMEALFQAKNLPPGAGPRHTYYVVRLLNGGVDALNNALVGQGQPAFSFLVSK